MLVLAPELAPELVPVLLLLMLGLGPEGWGKASLLRGRAAEEGHLLLPLEQKKGVENWSSDTREHSLEG